MAATAAQAAAETDADSRDLEALLASPAVLAQVAAHAERAVVAADETREREKERERQHKNESWRRAVSARRQVLQRRGIAAWLDTVVERKAAKEQLARWLQARWRGFQGRSTAAALRLEEQVF